jgi:DNA excision repair protein ERCC-4
MAPRHPLPAELKPEDVTAIVDTREKLPYDLSPLRSIVGTLDLVDYSILGQQDRIGAERKSLSDYVSSLTSDRDAFERRVKRARSLDSYCIIVEATWQDLLAGNWRSRATPTSIIGSTLAFMGEGIPILFCGTHEAGQQATARFLFCAARRRYRELRGLLAGAVENQQHHAEVGAAS